MLHGRLIQVCYVSLQRYAGLQARRQAEVGGRRRSGSGAGQHIREHGGKGEAVAVID